MPSPVWDDLDTFIDPEDFGSVAVCRAQGGTGTPFNVTGIFDDPSLAAEAGEFDVAAGKPTFRCKGNDARLLKKHDTVTITDPKAGTTTMYYLDHDPHAVGDGMCVLELGLE